MYSSSRHRRNNSSEHWPGFVDVLSSLLLVLIFLLVVYMLAQYFLQRTVSGQSEALNQLNRQVAELAEMLSIEQKTNKDLGIILSQLTSDLEDSNKERNELQKALTLITIERDSANLTLQKLEEQSNLALSEAKEKLNIEKEHVRALLADVERLRRDISALNAVREDLELKVTELSNSLKLQNSELTELKLERQKIRDLSKELEQKLSSQKDQTVLAQQELSNRDIRLRELQDLYLRSENSLAEEEKLSSQQQQQIEALNQQILLLREQLSRIEKSLEASEDKSNRQEVVIADLGKRLNLALAAKVEELAQYRSEFFGKLRDVLADRRDFSIIGDRFVFQSEVLFRSGKADLNEEGKKRLATFAGVLKDVIPRIPEGLPWILQVDGHTDKRPIRTQRFPSNWELSSARAISVVNFLNSRGIPANRLSATGYGEFQPLDLGEDEIGYRRNRRIELKLTQR